MHSLVTGFKMNMFILVTVEASASVNIYAAHIIALRTARSLPGMRI